VATTNFVSQQEQVTRLSTLVRLDAMCAAGGEWNACKIGLYKNDKVPGPNDALADYVPADFAGYALSSAITWLASNFNTKLQAEAVGDAKLWSPTSGATPNTIYGYFIVDTTGATLRGAERFPVPVQMNDTFDALVILPIVRLPCIS
jgi:hypothetical protein